MPTDLTEGDLQKARQRQDQYIQVLTEMAKQGRSPLEFPAPPTNRQGETIAKDTLRGVGDALSIVAQGAAGFTANTVQQLGSIPLTPFTSQEDLENWNIRHLFPKDSVIHQVIQESPETVGAAVWNIWEATGFPEALDENLAAYRTGAKGEAVLLEKTGDLSLGDKAWAFGETLLEYMLPINEGGQALKAYSEGDTRKGAEQGFLTLMQIVPLARIGRGPSKLTQGLKKLPRSLKVTMDELKNRGLIDENGRISRARMLQLTEQEVLDLEAINETTIPKSGVETFNTVNQNRLSSFIRAAMNKVSDGLTDAEKAAGKAEPQLMKQFALYLRQGRFTDEEIARVATSQGITPEQAAAQLGERLGKMAQAIEDSSSLLGTELGAYGRWHELFKTMEKVRTSGFNMDDAGSKALANLRAKYKQDPVGLGGTAWKSLGILAKGTLAPAVSSIKTTVRDFVSQTKVGAQDLFEKGLADLIIRGVGESQELSSKLKKRWFDKNAPLLLDWEENTNVAANIFSGYLSEMNPKERALVTEIIAKLPGEATDFLTNIDPDIAAQDFGLAAAMSQRSFIKQLTKQYTDNVKMGGKNMSEGMKAMLASNTFEDMLAGFEHANVNGFGQLVSAHRKVPEFWQSHAFFAGKLDDLIKRSDGLVKDREDFLRQLADPNRDKRIDQMYAEAVDFAKERTFRLDPDDTQAGSWVKSAGNGLLDFYKKHPEGLLILPKYPRFIVNRYSYLMKRNPLEMFGIFRKDVRDALLGRESAVDMKIFDKTAAERGLKAGTPEYDKALRRARLDLQREAAENISRGVSGTLHLMGALAFRKSSMAGVAYSQIDAGSVEDPSPLGQLLIKTGQIDIEGMKPGTRIVLDARAFDPGFAEYLAVADFLNTYAETNDMKTAAERFTAADLGDLIFGMRNLENSGMNFGQILRHITDPRRSDTGIQGFVTSVIGDEILAPYTTPVSLITEPLRAVTSGSKNSELDLFSDVSGRAQNNFRGFFTTTGSDLLLNDKLSPGSNNMPTSGEAAGLVGLTVTGQPALTQLIRGANMRQIDYIGQQATEPEKREMMRQLNNFLDITVTTDEYGEGKTFGETISDAIVFTEVQARLNGAENDVILAMRQTLLRDMFSAMRETVKEDVQAKVLEHQPLLFIDQLIAKESSPIVKLAYERMRGQIIDEGVPNDVLERLKESGLLDAPK